MFIATPGKITLLGLDADHLLKITLDGAHVSGVRLEDVRAAHTRIALGPGGSNVRPAGEDVVVSDTPGSDHRSVACDGDFVPFPDAAGVEPRRSERFPGEQNSNIKQGDGHSKQLSAADVRLYSMKEFLSGPDGWNPALAP